MPNDEIFDRQWQWKRPKKEEEADDEYITDEEGWYSNLPHHDDKTIKNTNRWARPKHEGI